MHPTRHRRPPASLSVLVGALFVGLPPHEATRAPLSRDLPERCRAYGDANQAVWYCAAQSAADADSVNEVQRLCGAAGPYQGECLRGWVMARMDQREAWSTNQLLAACGPSDDCRLTVLDGRPAWTVREQLRSCAAAGRYASDCAAHALQRWAWTEPTAPEIAHLASTTPGFAVHVGNLVAAAVVCGAQPTCVGTPEVRAACSAALPTFEQDRRRCSQYEPPKDPFEAGFAATANGG